MSIGDILLIAGIALVAPMTLLLLDLVDAARNRTRACPRRDQDEWLQWRITGPAEKDEENKQL